MPKPETRDFVSELFGDERALDQSCRDHGHDWRTVTQSVEVLGWPAAWRECAQCGIRRFVWLPGDDASASTRKLARDIRLLRDADDGQGSLFI